MNCLGSHRRPGLGTKARTSQWAPKEMNRVRGDMAGQELEMAGLLAAGIEFTLHNRDTASYRACYIGWLTFFHSPSFSRSQMFIAASP